MRIALITRYFDGTNAGIGRVSSELLKGLLNEGHEVIPICTTKESLYRYMVYSTVELYDGMPSKSDVYHSVTPVESLWTPKDKSVSTILDLIPVLHPDKCGAGIGYNKALNAIGTGYFKYCVKQAVKSRFITTISESTKQSICDMYDVPEDKVVVVKPGISPLLKPDFYPFMKGNTYGYLGQLDRRKRVDVLIESFLRYASIDGKLLIAGKGRDEAKLKTLAGDDSRVVFLGYLDDSEIPGFYNSLDYFIFPTMIEGYGLPIVEAAACGTPVVTLSDAIIPKEVKSHTIVVDDLRRLFAAPDDYILSEPELRINVVWAQSHSWDKYVKRHIELYREVMNG